MKTQTEVRYPKQIYKLAPVWKTHGLNFTKVAEAKILSNFLADSVKGKRVLDVACGFGCYSMEISRAGAQVYGIDISKPSVEIARYCGASALIGDAESLPFQSNVFDSVLCACSLEHFGNDEAALEEMSRVLKKGGTLILSVDSFSYQGVTQHIKEIHRRKFNVVRYYSLASLEEKLHRAGFEIQGHKYFFNSPISSFILCQYITGKVLLFQLLFPLVYVLSALSDRWLGRNGEGYFLAVKAKKTFEHTLRHCRE